MKSDLRIYIMLAIVTILLVANVGLYFQFKQLEDQVNRLTQLFQPPETLQVGEMAPDVELVDFAGQRISLKDYEGLPVLLIFSSVSCPACQEFWPHLLGFSTENTSLTMLMISRGTLAENSDLAESQGFIFPVLQWDDAVAETYKVPGTPFIYLVSEEQTIAFAGFGPELERVNEIISVNITD